MVNIEPGLRKGGKKWRFIPADALRREFFSGSAPKFVQDFSG
jgi:hypothetical protein